MKKFAIASVTALAGLSLVYVPALRAQEAQPGLTIQNPTEFAAYQNASSQTDPKAKAAAEEDFLKQYPQSVAKPLVLKDLVQTYWQLQDQNDTLSAANRVLQIDPNNPMAILYSVIIKKGQCAQTSDAQTCDDAAALAQKGLTATKPSDMDDAHWQQITHAAYPIYDGAIAIDDVASKKDYKDAQTQYTNELKLYSDAESKTTGLNDTLLLAQAYSQPGSSQNLVQAVWFYARVWNFAPDQYKAQIEPKLEYYYKKYHGGLDGLDAIKQQAATSLFPPANFTIAPAKSPAEQIHDLITSTPDLTTLALADKETILALGSPDDANKLWTLLKDKQTQVPGVVIAATNDQIKVAVTQDAQASKVADFVVNLKKPLTDAELKLYQPGFEFKVSPEAELAGTYDSYTKVPATATTSDSAQIVLREGEVIPAEKKKPTPVHHRPAHN
jgi:hypothetical protein